MGQAIFDKYFDDAFVVGTWIVDLPCISASVDLCTDDMGMQLLPRVIQSSLVYHGVKMTSNQTPPQGSSDI